MPRSYIRRGGDRRPLPASQRNIKFYQPQFYDPYFFIQGSVPEKMVMAELVRRNIYFEHTPQTNPIEWGMLKSVASSDPTNWEADFLFPQYKIWLEVQGAYFHTLPGVPEKEALRFVLIEAAGWRPIYWWDYDIEARLPELMDAVPEFYRPKKKDQKGYRRTNGIPFYEGGMGVDHLAGLRKANQNRAQTPQYMSRYRRLRRPKGKRSLSHSAR
jgi:hypothetical protein